MKIFLIIILSLLAMSVYTQENKYFKKPFRLKVQNVYIDISSHTCPYIYDYNKDGVDDLLVGDFGEKFCPGVDTTKSHAFVQARCRVFINSGTNNEPIYETPFFLLSDGVPAYVPNTCCNSFTPWLADINDDGADDLFSGSFPGEIYYFEAIGDGKFKKSQLLRDVNDKVIKAGHSSAIAVYDYDKDGDYDLIVSSGYNFGAGVYENIGTKKKAVFDSFRSFDLKKYKYVKEDMDNFIGKALPTHCIPTDWDNDGLFDLVCGDDYGNIIFYKNIGEVDEPLFAAPLVLRDNPNCKKYLKDAIPNGNRSKVYIYDYNKDGKDDILLGDVYYATEETRELTNQERILKDSIQRKLNIATADFMRYIEKFNENASNLRKEYPNWSDQEINKLAREKVPKDMIIKYDRIKTKVPEYKRILEELDNERPDYHGFIWVYLRK